MRIDNLANRWCSFEKKSVSILTITSIPSLICRKYGKEHLTYGMGAIPQLSKIVMKSVTFLFDGRHVNMMRYLNKFRMIINNTLQKLDLKHFSSVKNGAPILQNVRCSFIILASVYQFHSEN